MGGGGGGGGGGGRRGSVRRVGGLFCLFALEKVREREGVRVRRDEM